MKTEYYGKCHYSTFHSAYCSCVGAYFPPHIDYRADYLNHQCHYKYACHEMRYVHTLHNIHTDEIAKDRNDVWHHTALTLTEFDKSPTLVMAIETDEKRGKKDGEYIYKSKHHYLVRQWQKTQITERKQCYESHGGEVKGIENRAQHSRSQYYFIGSLHSSLFTLHSFLFILYSFLILFTGIPSISRYFDTVRLAIG